MRLCKQGCVCQLGVDTPWRCCQALADRREEDGTVIKRVIIFHWWKGSPSGCEKQHL